MEEPVRGSDAPKLIETLAHRPGAGLVRLALHLDRLQEGAARLGYPCDRAAAQAALEAAAPDGPARMRLTLDADGRLEVSAAPLPAEASEWRYVLSDVRLDPDDPMRQVKSTSRAPYVAARAAMPGGADEALLLNTRGELAEGTISTLFLERDGVLLTPPLASGALPGVLRRALLDEGRAREAVLWPADLAGGGVRFGNSVRGLIRATRLR